MDDKDLRLIAELFRNPLATHVQLGRAAAISAASAGRRLQALEDGQVIAGYFAVPAASILGRQEFLVKASTSVSTRFFPMRLLEDEYVVWAIRQYDGALTVCLHLPSGVEPAAAGFGADKGWEPAGPKAGTPGAGAPLSEPDWRLIDAMIDHPRQEVPELARRTGMTDRTVRTRRESFIANGILQVRPVLLSPQGPGVLLFNLHVRLHTQEAASRVRQAVRDAIVVSEAADPPALSFLCRAHSFFAVQDLRQRLVSKSDVAEAWFTLDREAAIARDRLHDWVRHAAQAAAR